MSNTLTQQIIDDKTGEVLSSRKLKGNGNFVMLFRNNMDKVIELTKLDNKAAALFLFLVEQMNTDNAVVISSEGIAEAMEWGIATVYRKIAILKKASFLQVYKVGTANCYRLNSDLVWSTWANKKEFTKFRASVVITRTENPTQ